MVLTGSPQPVIRPCCEGRCPTSGNSERANFHGRWSSIVLAITGKPPECWLDGDEADTNFVALGLNAMAPDHFHRSKIVVL